MLKLMGAILVITACAALSAKSVIKKRNSLSALRELADTLAEIARSIDFQLVSLPGIITQLSQTLFTNKESFINRLAGKAEANPGAPFSASWQEAFENFSRDKSLPVQAESLMKSIGETLGKMDVETEKNRLISGRKVLTELADEMESNHKKTEKMMKSLGIILGIFIVILFL